MQFSSVLAASIQLVKPSAAFVLLLSVALPLTMLDRLLRRDTPGDLLFEPILFGSLTLFGSLERVLLTFSTILGTDNLGTSNVYLGASNVYLGTSQSTFFLFSCIGSIAFVSSNLSKIPAKND